MPAIDEHDVGLGVREDLVHEGHAGGTGAHDEVVGLQRRHGRQGTPVRSGAGRSFRTARWWQHPRVPPVGRPSISRVATTAPSCRMNESASRAGAQAPHPNSARPSRPLVLRKVAMKRSSYYLSVLVATAALGSLTACSSDDSSSAAAAPPPPPGTTAPAATTSVAPAGAPAEGCPSGAATSVPSPVTDAA